MSKIQQINNQLLDIFKDIKVISEKGKSCDVPVVWGDGEELNFPIIGLEKTNIDIKTDEFSSLFKIKPELTYNLHIRTLFQEEMNQITEQIVKKFDNECNCKIIGCYNNGPIDKSDKEFKANYYMFSLTVDGWNDPVKTRR